MILQKLRHLIINICLITNNIWTSISFLSFNKKCILIFGLFLLFNCSFFKHFFFLLMLHFLFLEYILVFVWIYEFYYCHSINKYHCLDLNYIFTNYISKNFFNRFYLYILINSFKKFYFIISKKKINLSNFFILLIVLITHIPIKSILFIYDIIVSFNVDTFLTCKKKIKFLKSSFYALQFKFKSNLI